MNTKPYCYLLGWPDKNKWYYGVRYAKNCDPSELFVTYFTSSKHVKNVILENGNPSIIEIRKTFTAGEQEQARKWEHTVLRRMRVIYEDKWINKTDNKAMAPLPGELSPSKRPDVRLKISQNTKKNTPRGDNHPRRLNPEKWANANTEEVNNRRREKVKNSENSFKKGEEKTKASCIHCRVTMPLGHIFRWHGDNCKQNPNRIIKLIKCPHCGLEGERNMKQFHFDNCKYNPDNKDLSRFEKLEEIQEKRKQEKTNHFCNENSPTKIRVSCVGCHKETNIPGLSFHKACITGNASDRVTHKKIYTVSCPHCNKIGAKGIMKRWHFDNCKLKS